MVNGIRPEPWPAGMEGLILAKSAEKGAGQKGESLAWHTWQVLSRLAEFMALRPQLPQQLGYPRLWHCLYWATFLHDFGKAMPGFQQGVLGNDAELKAQWGRNRHELFSLAFLDWIAEGLSEVEKLWAAAGIISHHRDAAEIQLLYPFFDEDEGGSDPLVAHLAGLPAGHLQLLHGWLADCGWAWARALGLAEMGVEAVGLVSGPQIPFADYGLARIRFWLEAYRDLTEWQKGRSQWAGPLLVVRGMLINADHSGSAHAGRLPRVQFGSEGVLAGLNRGRGRPLAWSDLFEHQMRSGRVTGSALLVAPTGSGKTEAALLWAAGQANDGLKPPRLFYTLPYQASMNAMLGRLQELFDPPGTAPEKSNVGLQHGRALLATYRRLMEREEEPSKAGRIARWMKNLGQLNYPPIRVFSPYQLLKGMYRLKGYEAQLTDYHNGLFIFDEIHAYEPKRLALILKSIAYLSRHYNARFFVMSATFPKLVKGWLLEALGQASEIKASPELFAQFQRHRLHLIEGELLAHLDLIADQARSGKSVLVVCNLVANAQAAYQALSQQLAADGIEVLLLHGRFNQLDRLVKEKRVQDCTGAKSQHRQPIVLVATQVVEVSLDIDLETIYSEPAPLEALIQRFGRVNRRRLMCDEDGRPSLAPVHVFSQPEDGQKIYNPLLISGTLAVLGRENGKAIDEAAVGDWLDEIYEGPVATQWRAEFEKEAKEFEQVVLNPLRPFQSDEGLEERFDELFDGVEVLPAALENEFLDAKEVDWILAGQYLVPIRWGQFHQLRRNLQLRKAEVGNVYIAEVWYDGEVGLDLTRPVKMASDNVWDFE